MHPCVGKFPAHPGFSAWETLANPRAWLRLSRSSNPTSDWQTPVPSSLLPVPVLPKTKFGKMLILSGPASDPHAAAADPSLSALLHQTGTTLSPLRPAGFARIDGKKVDVVTRGEMLDANCPIKVLEVTGNRVVVGRS